MGKKYSFSKTLFMEGIRCPLLLWLRMNKPELAEPYDETTLHLFEVGRKVELLARTPFPGILVERDGVAFSDLVQKTTSLMSNHTSSIYEATFDAKNCYCRVDILEPVNHKKRSGWNLHEVKMSTQVKAEHDMDCGFQSYCITQAGYSIKRINLIHINSEYNRQGNVNPLELFKVVEITELAKGNSKEIRERIKEFSEMCSVTEPPKVMLGSKCKNPGRCQYYNYCHKSIGPGSVYEIPYGSKIIPHLLSLGISRIADIPDSLKPTKRQKALIKSAKTNKPVIDLPEIKEFLGTFKYPLYFLDFETIAPCIPAWDNTCPYEKIPFQYSLHILENPNGKTKHFEYLHDSKTDPRDSLIEQLLDSIKREGTIVAWNKSFEESVLKSIGKRFPKYLKQINDLLPRFKDLITPFRNGAYSDVRFRGSSSIKKVLPVLVPRLSYDSMTIKRGDVASLYFERYIENSLPEDDWRSFRKDLLQYCGLDTLSMVEIYKKLCRICKKSQGKATTHTRKAL